MSNTHPLRAAREACNLTIDELAEEVKVGAKTIWNAENNHPISAKCRQLICEYFGKTSQELGLISARRGEKIEQIHLLESPIKSVDILYNPVNITLNSITLPAGKHITEEERFQLTGALGDSISNCWKLSIRTPPAQMLAIAQAHLYLVQQAHSVLHYDVRPAFYSSVYRLTGIALQFQGYTDEAFKMHEKSYIAALEGADIWNMAQSLLCQANIHQSRSMYSAAQEAIEATIRLISYKMDKQSLANILLNAHLYAINAENAAYMSEFDKVQTNLALSQTFLEYLPTTHEEFDKTSWHQYAGVCALIGGQYDIALNELQSALDMLPREWLQRHAIILIQLFIAHARKHDLDATLIIANKAISVLETLQSPGLSRQFAAYAQNELQQAFPGNQQTKDLIINAQRILLLPQYENKLSILRSFDK